MSRFSFSRCLTVFRISQCFSKYFPEGVGSISAGGEGICGRITSGVGGNLLQQAVTLSASSHKSGLSLFTGFPFGEQGPRCVLNDRAPGGLLGAQLGQRDAEGYRGVPLLLRQLGAHFRGIQSRTVALVQQEHAERRQRQDERHRHPGGDSGHEPVEHELHASLAPAASCAMV